MIECWQSFINFCNNGHQWIFFTIMFIFWNICYFLLLIEMWISDKIVHKVKASFKEYLKSTLADQDQKIDFCNIIPYVIFAPAYLALSTIIFIISIFYWTYTSLKEGAK